MRFNWEYYITINSDLCNNGILTEKIAYEHFKKFGIKEKRLYCDISIFFDWKYYLSHNKDLNNILGEQDAWRHFLYHGKIENRKLKYKEYLLEYCI